MQASTHDNTDIDRILQEVSKEIVQAHEQQREEKLIYDEQLEEMIEQACEQQREEELIYDEQLEEMIE